MQSLFSRSSGLRYRKNDRFSNRICIFFFISWEPAELGNSSSDSKVEKKAIEGVVAEENDKIPMLRFVFAVKIALEGVFEGFRRVKWGRQTKERYLTCSWKVTNYVCIFNLRVNG